jgi:hypothetical protein
MALPISRNTDYTAASPIKSVDLNDLQDAVIAAQHGSITVPIPAAGWQPRAGGGGNLGDGKWTFSSATVLVAALPRLPVGTVIEQVVYGYNRGGAGTVTCQARKRNIVTGTVTALIGTLPAGDTTGSAHETHTDALNYTVEANTGVWLEVTCDNAANEFVGAVVTINKP